MNFMKIFGNTALKLASSKFPVQLPLQIQSCFASSVEKVTHRKPSPCEVCIYPPDKRPCFDIRNLTVQLGNNSHANQIRSFLYTEYWPREPSVVGLWMSLNCSYLDILSDKYANSGIVREHLLGTFSADRVLVWRRDVTQSYPCEGDRLLALEHIKRTNEQKLVGVSVANKIFPWAIDELEEWAHHTVSTPERNRMYFTAHCLRSPDLFKKYNVEFIYEVEVLATAAEVSAQGVATALLRTALAHAEEKRYPLVQVIAVSQYMSRICEKCGMKREWTMDYADFVDDAGQRVFFPRRPHHTVAIYITHYDPALGFREPCKPPFL